MRSATRLRGGIGTLHSELRYKRLEKGRFRWPEADGQGAKVTLSQEELMLLVGGIDLTQTRRRAWHRVAALGSKNDKTNIINMFYCGPQSAIL